jgi:acetoin utilization deacetylase AcuC-like enzyme
MLGALTNRILRWTHGRDLAVWHDAAYRLPLSAVEARTGFEPRRADFAAWFLLERHAISRENLRAPRPASYVELSRVHSPELLESLTRAETLGRVFSVDPSDVQVDKVLATVLLACGATIEAAREMLRPAPRELGRRALNLLGGFHHAGPSRAGGLCAVNDVAVAIAAVRADGFSGRIAVLDLDAHPPDGTAECLARDADCWIGSISGSDFGQLPRVDETLLPPGSGDAAYLAALEALLARMPETQLAFVLAGGDVLAGDVAGQLALTLEGCRARDLRVADALLRTPSVWLPAGGYSRDAWRVLAGTGLALGVRSSAPIRPSYDPLGARYRSIAASLATEELGSAENIDAVDLEQELGIAQRPPKLLLGFYSLHGIEYGLHRYGLMGELQRRGYGPLRVALAHDGVGETVRIFDQPSGEVLLEVMLEKKRIAGADLLYVHWLTLRNPRARFSDLRPQLPGQDMPGLGLAREITELLTRMAARLGLEGLAIRPSSYHTAYYRYRWRFVDPQRQGRFEALERDLAGLALLDATRAIAEGRVRMDGEPYQWEADEMVLWLKAHPEDRAAIEAERERVKFTVG